MLKGHGRIARLAAELPLRALADNLDLLHVQYVAPIWSPVPVVATIHDISFKLFPEWFARTTAIGLSAGVSMTLARAAHIITISEASREELITHYGVARSSLSVTYLGVAEGFAGAPASREGLAALGVTTPFVLTVGNVQPRKNYQKLVEAFALMIERDPSLTHVLVVAGREANSQSQLAATIAKEGLIERVILTGYVSDEMLVQLYKCASAFVFPSFYEGFGLCLIEAMAAGTPVLTSDTSCLQEVAGGAARYFDPSDPASIAEALSQVLSDTRLARNMTRLGTLRAKEFTWASTARKTIDAYERSIHR